MRINIHKIDKSSLGTFCSYILPLILLLQISVPGVALCIGSDGHVALEDYSDGLCNEMVSKSVSLNNSDVSLRSLNSFDNQHCGICVDVLISDNNSENKIVSSNDLIYEFDIHALSLYLLKSQIPLESSSHNLLVQEIPTYKSFLDSLHTTVITC